ncbi:hypothetical protein AK812_SmicGene27840 [Symbiodinium microadriaticum]|uniref:Uncharacterized protein n=1 Tax=Symbiodinium microadriaticum TaxID=2951 RepID=A0A1Q9D5Y7_SYMMI|nr:hypothetical protein AK812_SmicGene27840 [Symbiodinium microadriaticum]
MSTYTDLEHFSSGGWLTSASTVPQIRKTSANASFLNLGGLAGAAFGAATSAAGPFGGAVGGLTGGLAGKAGSGPILMPEPKAEDPRDRFKLMLDFKRTGYPDDHYPQPDAGSPGQLAFAALHWSRHEVANALRAMESMRFVEQQAQVAKAIADKAAVQLTYLMESPCLRGVTQPASAASAPPDLQRGLWPMQSMCPLEVLHIAALRCRTPEQVEHGVHAYHACLWTASNALSAASVTWSHSSDGLHPTLPGARYTDTHGRNAAWYDGSSACCHAISCATRLHKPASKFGLHRLRGMFIPGHGCSAYGGPQHRSDGARNGRKLVLAFAECFFVTNEAHLHGAMGVPIGGLPTLSSVAAQEPAAKRSKLDVTIAT